jgi:chemotaxis protein methyltransferase CheR
MTDSSAQDLVVHRVAELLLQRVGLRVDPSARGRLRRAIRDEGGDRTRDASAYLDSLAEGGAALQGLLNRVTVQETAFFRHPEQFEVLARDVLPGLPRPVKLWSAGCANGQEAFSLAMLLEEQRIDGSVIGTDLSTSALQRTAAGQYATRELSGLSPRRIAIHGQPTTAGWQINDAVRRRVITLHHNLLDPPPPEVRSSKVIFCRNVLIYMSPEHAGAFLERIAETFPPATAIFLGAAETIWQVSDRFTAVPTGNTFIHRQTVAAAASQTRDRRLPAVEHTRPGLAKRMPPPALMRNEAAPPSMVPHLAVPPTLAREPATAPDRLARVGQDAIAAGDFRAAVVAFRKCAYLLPRDPVAQLQLGLALEAAGDERSAQRAYAAARHALLNADPVKIVAGIAGYDTGELGRLLDYKQQGATQ